MVAFCYCNEISEINQLKKKKGLFWLTVLVISVHGQLALCFWACGKVVHYSKKDVVEKAAHLMVAREQREKKEEESGSHYSLQGHAPNVLMSFHWVPLSKVPPLPNSTMDEN
jgi:hypothetical protein